MPAIREFVFFDSPAALDCTVTPIPASSSSPLQVVADLAIDTTTIVVFDGIGFYVGLYTGASGHEELLCIIGGGISMLYNIYIPIGTRISLRNINNVAINTGSLCVQFALVT